MIPKVWAGLFKLIEEGKYRSTVFQADNVKPFVGLEHVGRALRLLEEKESWGKVVIDVPLSGSLGYDLWPLQTSKM
jgi:NADPH2:quinone reductase